MIRSSPCRRLSPRSIVRPHTDLGLRGPGWSTSCLPSFPSRNRSRSVAFDDGDGRRGACELVGLGGPVRPYPAFSPASTMTTSGSSSMASSTAVDRERLGLGLEEEPPKRRQDLVGRAVGEHHDPRPRGEGTGLCRLGDSPEPLMATRRVRLFAALRRLAGAQRVDAEGSTVGEVIDVLSARYGERFEAIAGAGSAVVDGERAQPRHPLTGTETRSRCSRPCRAAGVRGGRERVPGPSWDTRSSHALP